MKKMNIQSVTIATFLVVLVAIGVYLIYKHTASQKVVTYTNSKYGMSFQYPGDYKITEHMEDTATSSFSTITLTEKGIRIPQYGEGPTAITISIYPEPKNAGKESNVIKNWITTSSSSNFNLSTMHEPGITQIANQEGYLYTWDGLYQGTTVVTEHDGNIFSFTVTYDGETDMEKREIFTELIASTQFYESGTQATTTPAQ